jgi:hypothetical protein
MRSALLLPANSARRVPPCVRSSVPRFGCALVRGVDGGFLVLCAGSHELVVGEGEGCGGDLVERELVERGVVAADALERVGVGGAVRVEEVLGLFSVLFEGGSGGQGFGHTKLLSGSPGVRTKSG